MLTPMQDKLMSIDCACVVSTFEVRIILMVLQDRISRKRLKAREKCRSNFVQRNYLQIFRNPYNRKKTVVGSNDSNEPRYWLEFPYKSLTHLHDHLKAANSSQSTFFFNKIDLLPLFRSMSYLCPCKIYEIEMFEPRSETQR